MSLRTDRIEAGARAMAKADGINWGTIFPRHREEYLRRSRIALDAGDALLTERADDWRALANKRAEDGHRFMLRRNALPDALAVLRNPGSSE